MKLIRWEFLGLCMPMMEDESGELYCTSKAICEALGINEHALRMIINRNKKEFGSLRVTDRYAKEFFQANKTEFGIERVRSDIRLWSEDDMLTFAFHSKSDDSLEFRQKLRKFIKLNAKRNCVTVEQFEQLKGQFDALCELVKNYIPAANDAASFAGRALRAQRETKPLREVTVH
jgi:prophage antirepressor-like protein